MGNLNGKLVEAVEENRLEDVKELLGLGASQDAQDKVLLTKSVHVYSYITHSNVGWMDSVDKSLSAWL